MKKAMLLGSLLMTLALLAPISVEALDPTWVRMAGHIEYYGEDRVWGWVGAYAKVEEWANVTGAWMSGKPMIAIFPPLWVCVVNLTRTDMVKLNYTGKDFYISGAWDIYNVTWFSFCNKSIEYIVEDAPGDLSVTGNWTDFIISIEDAKPIKGKVIFHCKRTIMPIPIGDVNYDCEVDIFDLVKVAKAYGSSPGIPAFGFDLDLDFDFQVGLCDLATIAANLGETYKT